MHTRRINLKYKARGIFLSSKGAVSDNVGVDGALTED